MFRPRGNRRWNVRASSFARNTHNPIREIIEDLKVQPNPNKSFIPLSVGDPSKFGNLVPPQEVLNAVRESVDLKESRSYGPLVGHYEARKAIAEYCTFLEEINPDDVIVCSGCSHAVDLIVTTIAEAGQNILVPRPGYAIYKTSGEGLGIEMKYYDLLPKENWKVDLKSFESVIDQNTVAIVVNNPSNPCGSVYSKEHLCEILDVASKYHLPIIADEIYGDFVFPDKQFIPIADLSKHVPVFTCSGLTKRFLVPGWRLGWIVVRDRNGILGKEFRKAMSNISSRILGANTLIQKALPQILECATHKYFSDMMLFIQNQAKIACTELQKASGLHPVMPEGSMYMMIEIKVSVFPKFKNDLHFIKTLCEEQSVLCIPGQCFNYPGYMRIVLTVPEDVLLEACSRIIAFCNEHVKNPADETNSLCVEQKLRAMVV